MTRMALAFVVVKNYAHEGLMHSRCAGGHFQALRQFLPFQQMERYRQGQQKEKAARPTHARQKYSGQEE